MPKQINSQDELPEGEAIGTGNDARVALLDSIGDRNDVTRAEELGDVNDDGTVTEFTAPEMTEEDQGEAEAELQAVGDEAGAVQENLERAEQEANAEQFTIKVGGKEIQLSREELITRAQKVEAADAYLAEAARIRKEAERSEQSSKDVATTEEEERALVRAIQMGTEDEALAAIRKVRAVPSFNKDDISRTVDERLNFNQAAERFGAEYKDVMGDPVLRQMVLNKDRELLNAGDKRAFMDRWSDIGNNVRSWRDGLVKANSKDPLDAKRERKANAANPIKTADVKAGKTDEDDEKEPSQSEIISAIAKARGGPQWMRG